MEQRLQARRLPVRNAGSIASAVCCKERDEDIIGTTAVSAEQGSMGTIMHIDRQIIKGLLIQRGVKPRNDRYSRYGVCHSCHGTEASPASEKDGYRQRQTKKTKWRNGLCHNNGTCRLQWRREQNDRPEYKSESIVAITGMEQTGGCPACDTEYLIKQPSHRQMCGHKRVFAVKRKKSLQSQQPTDSFFIIHR